MSDEKNKYLLLWYDNPCLMEYNEEAYSEEDREYFEKSSVVLLTPEEYDEYVRIENAYNDARDGLYDLQKNYAETVVT